MILYLIQTRLYKRLYSTVTGRV